MSVTALSIILLALVAIFALSAAIRSEASPSPSRPGGRIALRRPFYSRTRSLLRWSARLVGESEKKMPLSGFGTPVIGKHSD